MYDDLDPDELIVDGEVYDYSELLDSVIYCRSCGSGMEPDVDECYECGRPNPLFLLGVI
jgi:uncharacterized OB-fold protein